MSFAWLEQAARCSLSPPRLLCRRSWGVCAEPISFCHSQQIWRGCEPQCQKLPCKEVTENTEGGTVGLWLCCTSGTELGRFFTSLSSEALTQPPQPPLVPRGPECSRLACSTAGDGRRASLGVPLGAFGSGTAGQLPDLVILLLLPSGTWDNPGMGPVPRMGYGIHPIPCPSAEQGEL